jgi:hypothetical protein
MQLRLLFYETIWLYVTLFKKFYAFYESLKFTSIKESIYSEPDASSEYTFLVT